MTRVLEWLLDLEHIRLDRDAPLLLKWVGGVPAWLLLCAAAVVVMGVLAAYRRERASVGKRIVLGVLRCAILALVVAVLCQPALLLQRNRVEPAHTAVMLDTSLSMAVQEPYRDASLAASTMRGAGLTEVDQLARESRLTLVQKALTRDGAAPLRQLLAHNAVQLSTFSAATEVLAGASSVDGAPALAEQVESISAQGLSTNVPGAIEQTIRSTSGRRLAAIVLATDGQTTEPTALAPVLDLARDRKIPIYPLRVGSPQPVQDIEVGPLRAEESVFLHDILAVEAQVAGYGITEATAVNVRLVDERDATVMASIRVVLEPTADSAAHPFASAVVELRAKPTRAGLARYRVEAEPLPAERVTINNVDRVDMTIIEDPLRVLYVDGYPRYEYRYLKNALMREETIELSALLLEADEAFIGEGTLPIRRFPQTLEELQRYDVVLFGDVDLGSGWLADTQMSMLVDFVRRRGGGFGLIAGERAAPHSFLGTPLERLLPVRIDPQFLGHYETTLVTGYRPRLTPEGRRNRFFRLTPGDTLNRQDVATPQWGDADASNQGGGQTWGDSGPTEPEFEALPDLYWIARTLGARPGATVLIEHPAGPEAAASSTGSDADPLPVLTLGRFGSGKVLFQATDDTWRWRRYRMGGLPAGVLFHDTYWVQVVRMLSQPKRANQDRRFFIRTDRRGYAYGQRVQTLVEIRDSRLLGDQQDAITMTLKAHSAPIGPDQAPEGAGGLAAPAGSAAGRFAVHRLSPKSNKFEGTFVPPHTGSFSIQARDIVAPPGENVVSALIRVRRPDLEARRPEANHEALRRIAEATGGRVIDLDELDAQFAGIEDRSVRIPDDLTEPLWDSKLVFALFVLMISMEWALRKAFGLL